jgi:8-oxo-dGTP pyrophosphatase MutT (NUDIX family)
VVVARHGRRRFGGQPFAIHILDGFAKPADVSCHTLFAPLSCRVLAIAGRWPRSNHEPLRCLDHGRALLEDRIVSSTPSPSGTRLVARVLVLNEHGHTFLLRGKDSSLPDRAPFWFTPGGKIDAGETPGQAAARELFEEIGLIAAPEDLGEVIGTEDSAYHFEGIAYRQHGVFYAYRSNDAALNSKSWSDIEARTIDHGRYWSLEELSDTTETIYPAHLADMLASVLAKLTPPD